MKMKVVRPAKFNGSAITEELVAGANEIGKDVIKGFNDIVKTWNHKPIFVVKVQSTPRQIKLEATTDDAVFNYLDRGTSVRHAVMSRDFQPKTQPASGGVTRLSSGRGRGRMVHVSRRINRPGIKARGFTKAILESTQRDLVSRMEKHLALGVRKSGHKAGR